MMWNWLRRGLLLAGIVMVLGARAVPADFPLTDHTAVWFDKKFAQLHDNPGKEFFGIETHMTMPDDDARQGYKISLKAIYYKGNNPKVDKPYMVIAKAINPFPRDGQMQLANFMAHSHYVPGTPLHWIAWLTPDHSKVQYVLVGPPRGFVEQGIFKIPQTDGSGV